MSGLMWTFYSATVLLLKLSSAAITGAAALLALRRLHRDEALASLRRDICAALSSFHQGFQQRDGGATAPPTVLVIGFRSHGKSSFVNTVCRVLAEESGPLLVRAETAPPGPTPATLKRQVVRGTVPGREDGEELVVDVVDTQPLPEPGALTGKDLEEALVAADCVVLVLRCTPSKERNAAIKRLTDISNVIRERGLNLVVVLTHKKVLRTRKQAEELRKEVASRARTDCVYFIENYTASSSPSVDLPRVIKNDFETQFTVLVIIRQCIEFAMLYRIHSLHKPGATGAPTTIELLQPKEH